MFQFSKLARVLLAITLAGNISARAEVFQGFASLPPDATPGNALLQGQDGYLYGVLAFTEAFNSNAQTMGALYRISPLGEFSYIRRYPHSNNAGAAGAVGSEPNEFALAQGTDGYLYGLTNYGGAHESGVFYRTSPDGAEYQVIEHLPFNLNPNRNGGDFVQAAPNTFFAYHLDRGAIVRYAPEGVSLLQDTNPPPPSRLFAPDGVGGPLAVLWASAQNDIHVRLLDGNSGAFISEEVITTLRGVAGRVGIRGMRGNEIIVQHSPGTTWDPLPFRWLAIAPDRSFTEIAQFKVEASDTTRLEAPKQFLWAKDGSFYFSAGEQTKGLINTWGGTTVYHLTRAGVARKVSDLGGFPLGALCEGKDEFFYGVSWGPNIDFEPTQEEPAADFTNLSTRHGTFVANEMAREDSSADFTNSGTAAARYSVRTLARPPRTRHGAFKINRRPAELVNHLPLAKRDAVVLSRSASKTGAATYIRPLRNDRDPERKALSVESVGTPASGTANISTDGKRTAGTLVYVPARLPAASDRFNYTVRDEQGAESIGTVSIRGDVQGVYRKGANSPSSLSSGITISALNVKIARLGGIIATATLDGKPIILRGTLDFSDKATLTKPLKNGTVVTLSLELHTTDDSKRVLTYHLAKGDQYVEGTLAR